MKVTIEWRRGTVDELVSMMVDSNLLSVVKVLSEMETV